MKKNLSARQAAERLLASIPREKITTHERREPPKNGVRTREAVERSGFGNGMGVRGWRAQ